MKKYEDFIEGLQQEADMPDRVWARYEDVLENIDQLSTQRKGEDSMRTGRKTEGRTWVKAAAVAGIFVAGLSIFSVSNPVAASKLPIIGRIFENIGEDVTYSGDYSGKKALQETSKEETKDESESLISVKDQGITITASEIYSDGYSVYLAARIESESGGFDNIPSHYTRRFGEKTSKSIYAGGTWKINDGEEEYLSNASFEGKSIDDCTFIGMLKLDQNQYSDSDGTLDLELSEFYYDDFNESASDSIEPSNRIGGSWSLTVPYTVDKEQCREIPVNQKNEDGYSIEKVFLSPYQIIVFSEVPYTTLSPEDFTREEFEEVWGKKNEEMIASGEEAVTYEDMLAEKYYVPYEVAVFDQNGESIESQYAYENKSLFAVQGHEITKMHIYMTDASHELELIKADNEQEAAEMSILDVELDL